MADINKMIQWMTDRSGKVSYSMVARLGPNSYDCSSAVYNSLIAGDFLSGNTAIGNTETLFNDLEKNGWVQLTPVNGNYSVKRGDIFIWGTRGQTLGAAGHTGIFIDDNDQIIHCNYGYNGITVNDHDTIWKYNGCPAITIYRYKETAPDNTVGYKTEAFNKRLQTTDVLNVRTSPSSKSSQVASLSKGQVFTATKICKNGESINGNTTWYEQNNYGWVSGAYVKEVSAPSNGGLVSKSGTFIPDRRLAVSADTTVESLALAYYEKGQSIHYDSYIMSNGYAWISYIGGSGNRRYVAVGPDDGNVGTTWGTGFFN